MNYAAPLSDMLAQIDVSDRNPEWSEYEAASPCQRRAILSRWSAIKFEKGTLNPEGRSAFENYCKAVTAPDFVPDIQPYRAVVPGEYESAQERWSRGEEVIGPDTADDQGI